MNRAKRVAWKLLSPFVDLFPSPSPSDVMLSDLSAQVPNPTDALHDPRRVSSDSWLFLSNHDPCNLKCPSPQNELSTLPKPSRSSNLFSQYDDHWSGYFLSALSAVLLAGLIPPDYCSNATLPKNNQRCHHLFLGGPSDLPFLSLFQLQSHLRHRSSRRSIFFYDVAASK